VLGLLLLSGTTQAQDKDLYDRLAPRSQHASLGEQVARSIAELGNTLGMHAALLSHEMLAMKFDGQRRRAFIALGGGDDRFLAFKLANDVHFVDGLARINTKIDLTIRGRKIQVELPEWEMVPASYRGDRGVEVRVPIFRRRF
jgi:hypothetical protein